MKNIIVFVALYVFLISCDGENNQVTQIPVENLQEVLSTKKVQLLDVRTPQEWERGVIEGAIQINFFDENFEKMALEKLDQNQPVYVYCKSGGRSTKASNLLSKNGFEVYNVLGGYTAWQSKNN